MNKDDIEYLLTYAREKPSVILSENTVLCSILQNMVKEAIGGRYWTLAESYCGAGLALARYSGNTDLHAEFEKYMGQVKIRNNDDEAVRRLQRARTLYAHQNNISGIAECQLLLGDYYRKRSENWLAKLHYRQSLDLFDEISNEDGAAIASHRLGLVLRREGYLVEAAELQRRFVRYFISVTV